MKELKKPKVKGLSVKQKVFADHFIATGNKTQAAIISGTPAKTAKTGGYQMYNRPLVKAYIEKVLNEQSSTLSEITKLVNDIASANLSDYFRPVLIPHHEHIKVSLREVIKQEEERILQEEMFCERMGYEGEVFDDFQKELNYARAKIMKWEIELERNTKAFRIIHTETDLIEEQRLDINALVKDKERGRIKKLKYGKDGLEVELYSATDAIEKAIKMKGGYLEDNRQKNVAPKQVMVIGGKEIEF